MVPSTKVKSANLIKPFLEPLGKKRSPHPYRDLWASTARAVSGGAPFAFTPRAETGSPFWTVCEPGGIGFRGSRPVAWPYDQLLRPDCVTVNVSPAMVIVPVSTLVLVLAATV